jgi:2-C-methyl-D-erythritol 4-phosphate cytidylyltransferase/2-C-methyl-D-erythritol 2,4-cyclodiphosphate synthase
VSGGADPSRAVRTADVIVVAAGSSARMGGQDKLAAQVGGRPLLAWTLDALAGSTSVARIVVVTATAKVASIAGAAWLPDCVSAVVAGGARRQDSVAAGVEALADGPGSKVILIHDGARPLVSAALVDAVAQAAAIFGAAIPVLPVVDTLKQVEDGRVLGTVERSGLAAAQTPQGVRRDVLATAYAAFPPAGPETWTDEAALLEACRIPVHALPGESANLKVTLPIDLRLVEAALADAGRTVAASPAAATSAAPALRVGIGEDGHPFGPGTPLALGGIVIHAAPRLHGHSDGDVALHAVCDALLGAAGLGDLGRIFPPGRSTPAGIASRDLLAECVRRVRASGLVPLSLDVTITGARPRLAARLPDMRDAIAALLELPADRVNVKASTGNLAGWEGAGRGISARAVALVGELTG